jgi:DNA repair protein RecO (recombination protein O)
MLHKTNAIVLRALKYGETSLVVTVFTAQFGVQAYMMKGVRSAKSRQNKAAFFQPGMLLELVVYHQPQKNMQHISQYQPAHLYTTVQEHVVKNSVVLFANEVLLRLLPENAPQTQLFDFVFGHYVELDKRPVGQVANFPVYFMVQCSRLLGFEVGGNYSADTPYLHMEEGAFSANPPGAQNSVTTEDARALDQVLAAADYDQLAAVQLSAQVRMRLIDWYIAFLQLHTAHMGAIRSLSVLRAILHE